MFTVRYALSPYIKQAIFAFKGLNLIFISLTNCHVFKVKFWYKNRYCIYEGVYLSVKSNPITGPDRPWEFQKVASPRFQVSRHMKVWRLSVVRTGRLNPPGKIPGTHFCYRLSRPQGHSAAGLGQWKIPMTQSGIEPATFQNLKFASFVHSCFSQWNSWRFKSFRRYYDGSKRR